MDIIINILLMVTPTAFRIKILPAYCFNEVEGNLLEPSPSVNESVDFKVN